MMNAAVAAVAAAASNQQNSSYSQQQQPQQYNMMNYTQDYLASGYNASNSVATTADAGYLMGAVVGKMSGNNHTHSHLVESISAAAVVPN